MSIRRRSKPLLHRQVSCLLRLPLPPVQETLEKYAESLKPFVDADYMEKLQRLIERLCTSPSGIGLQLQDYIEEYSDNHINWAYQLWIDDMYMNQRLALPININPGMVMPPQEFPDLNSFTWFSSHVVRNVLRFRRIIENNEVNPDYVSERFKQHLCMQQYQHIFDCYRCPGLVKDEWIFSPFHSTYICVAHRNRLYKVQVLTENQDIMDVNDINLQLINIVTSSQEKLRIEESVNFLTALPRTEWAYIRENHLIKNQMNYTNLQTIQNCLFMLCLDDALLKVEARNPFFTKQCMDRVAIIIQETAGLTKPYKDLSTVKQTICQNLSQSPKQSIPMIELNWDLTPELNDIVARAAIYSNDQASRLEASILCFEGYGREFPKSQNCSPDGYIQLALQLTYYKCHNKIVHTYESASLRRFIKGRVDNIRAAHAQALSWVEAMQNPHSDIETKLRLFDEAIERQAVIIQQNIKGHGIDNHMLAMRVLGEESGLKIGEIFDSKEYAEWNYFKLSTSQIPTKQDFFMGYGPVVHDGYGCSYNPHASSIVFVISAFSDYPETNIQRFRENLIESLHEMKELLLTEEKLLSLTDSFINRA